MGKKKGRGRRGSACNKNPDWFNSAVSGGVRQHAPARQARNSGGWTFHSLHSKRFRGVLECDWLIDSIVSIRFRFLFWLSPQFRARKIPFLRPSLLPNPTEALATQARHFEAARTRVSDVKNQDCWSVHY